MESGNSFKTILWVIAALVVVIIGIFILTKNKNTDVMQDENMVIGQAMVDTIDVSVTDSFPAQVNVTAKGNLSDGCTQIGDVKQTYENKVFGVTLETKKPLDAEMCTQALVPFEKTFPLSGVVGLVKGTYSVDVNGVRSSFTLSMDNAVSNVDPLK
ncbi:MAG: hypothetical protein IT284_02330 [Bacteroidetes bacterium]|nr:hypothetical protein [Bacteroidota bacterium]